MSAPRIQGRRRRRSPWRRRRTSCLEGGLVAELVELEAAVPWLALLGAVGVKAGAFVEAAGADVGRQHPEDSDREAAGLEIQGGVREQGPAEPRRGGLLSLI